MKKMNRQADCPVHKGSRLKPKDRIWWVAAGLTLLLLAVCAGIFLFYHWFGFQDDRGLSLASSLQRQTDNLAIWSIEEKDGSPILLPAGKEAMDLTGGWLQVLDENGHSLLFYKAGVNDQSGNKAPLSLKTDVPPVQNDYSISELMAIAKDPRIQNGSCFISPLQIKEHQWTLLCSYPIPVASTIIYYNSATLPRLSPLIWLIPGFLMPFLFGLIVWQYCSMRKMTDRIRAIQERESCDTRLHFPWKSVDDALWDLENQLKTSDRLRQENDTLRRNWIAGVSHDLKTPLSPVKGYAELLITSKELDAANQHRYGQLILENAKRLEDRIENLQLAYRIEGKDLPFNPETLDFEKLVRDTVIDILNNPAFAQSDVEYEKLEMPDPSYPPASSEQPLCPSDTPAFSRWEVIGDGSLLRRAVENLTVNALRHNPAGTKIRLRMIREPGWITLSIRDNGRGISGKDCAHIFEWYYQAEKTRSEDVKQSRQLRGQGLGLSLAWQIVSLHRGTLKVHSKPGKGSEFILSLPVREDDSQNSSSEQPSSPKNE